MIIKVSDSVQWFGTCKFTKLAALVINCSLREFQLSPVGYASNFFEVYNEGSVANFICTTSTKFCIFNASKAAYWMRSIFIFHQTHFRAILFLSPTDCFKGWVFCFGVMNLKSQGLNFAFALYGSWAVTWACFCQTILIQICRSLQGSSPMVSRKYKVFFRMGVANLQSFEKQSDHLLRGGSVRCLVRCQLFLMDAIETFYWSPVELSGKPDQISKNHLVCLGVETWQSGLILRFSTSTVDRLNIFVLGDSKKPLREFQMTLHRSFRGN